MASEGGLTSKSGEDLPLEGDERGRSTGQGGGKQRSRIRNQMPFGRCGRACHEDTNLSK